MNNLAASPLYKIVLGCLLSPIDDQNCQLFIDGAMVLKRQSTEEGHSGNPDDGPLEKKNKKERPSYKFIGVGDRTTITQQFQQEIQNPENVETLDFRDHLLIPSFFDMHFHWVQDEVRSMPKDSLLHWLSTYTWPHEGQFKDRSFSQRKAQDFFKKLSKVGTLGGACYSSIHGHALEDAMRSAVGDFVIGNVLMTMNSPANLLQSPPEALNLVKKFSKKYGPRYALTPRFAPTTHPEVMSEGMKWACQWDCFIQSHLCETQDEIEYVLSIFKKFKELAPIKSYTEIYQKCGILSPKTILGHGNYLTDEERQMLAQTQSSIVHCPSSNAPIEEGGLGSGLCDFQKLEESGIRWALGSDIGGGPFLSMLDVMRSFVEQHQRAGVREATYSKAFYRATLAGAEILGLGKTHGQLETGKAANFLVLPMPIFKKGERKNPENILKKMIEQKAQIREDYESFVKWTIYEGNILYQQVSVKG